MADEHQTNAIIATAILDSVKDHPDNAIDPEEAKLSYAGMWVMTE